MARRRGPAVSSSARTRATPSSRSPTTSCTRPMRCAVRASKRSPVTKYRLAALSPILRIANGEMTAGMTPSLTSENANTRLMGDRESAHATRPAPPPSACPWTAATTAPGRCRSLRTFAQPVRLGHVALVIERGRGAHPLDVRTRAEALSLTCDHDRPRGSDIDEGLRECGDERRIERVSRLGTSQRDPKDLTVPLHPKRAHQRDPMFSVVVTGREL